MSPENNAEVPYGTLDLMALKTLAGMGPLHGFGIARCIEQVAEGALALNRGAICPALLRLEQKGWIKSEWGTSENNRRARFYSLTGKGKRHLAAEEEKWARTVASSTAWSPTADACARSCHGCSTSCGGAAEKIAWTRKCAHIWRSNGLLRPYGYDADNPAPYCKLCLS